MRYVRKQQFLQDTSFREDALPVQFLYNISSINSWPGSGSKNSCRIIICLINSLEIGRDRDRMLDVETDEEGGQQLHAGLS